MSIVNNEVSKHSGAVYRIYAAHGKQTGKTLQTVGSSAKAEL
jgi:hypothetical protein